MSHQEGTYLGGIRTVEDLRQRCRIDADTGCWHWGLAITQNHPKVHYVFEGKRISSRGRKAALLLAGRPPQKGHVAFATRNCHSDDCVNPDHARSSTRANHGQYLKASGKGKTLAKIASAKAAAASSKRKRLTWEAVREIRASDEAYPVLAARHGISPSRIGYVKRGEAWKEAPSVFNFRPASKPIPASKAACQQPEAA
jgi:hypothetical protein